MFQKLSHVILLLICQVFNVQWFSKVCLKYYMTCFRFHALERLKWVNKTHEYFFDHQDHITSPSFSLKSQSQPESFYACMQVTFYMHAALMTCMGSISRELWKPNSLFISLAWINEWIIGEKWVNGLCSCLAVGLTFTQFACPAKANADDDMMWVHKILSYQFMHQ